MARSIEEVRQMLKEEAEEKAIQEAKEPTTLLGRFFQEAGDDDDEGESLDDIEKDMDGIDDDDSNEKDDDDKDGDNEGEEPELGKDDSDVQNEYDEGDVSSLNELIADEQHAMQAYFKAGKETKNALLARLYNDIGAEEAFHSEQLLYAKAELTGEKYEPSDPEVKKEYEELLENGMDEETAMYTIADKHKLEIDIDEDGEDLADIEEEMENLEESFTMTMAGLDIMMAIQESAAYKTNKALREAYCEYFQCVQDTMFMEAMDNVATTQGSEILGTNNPFLIIGRMIKSIYMGIINLVRKLKAWVNKRRIKAKRARAWLKKHGIKGLFSDGVKLYCWNDQTNQVEVSDYIAYLTLLMNATHLVAKKLGIDPPNTKRDLSWAPKNNSKVPVITNPKDAIGKINGVVFSKSKVIVTDANANEIENMFFGLSEGKIQNWTRDTKTGEYGIDVKNVNIYNALNAILEAASAFAKATDEWMPSVQNTITSPGNNAATKNPTTYKECVDLMKEVTKGYQRLIKCITADISTCMKLDNGLLAAVQQGEQGHSEHLTDVANNRNDKNNTAGKDYKQYGDAAASIGSDGTSVPRMSSPLK